MDHLRNKKQEVLQRLLPNSVIKEVKCFVLYDHHPMDERQLDITVCTKYELQEYYQRELKSSIQINNASKITILRNVHCKLHYLVHSNNAIIILSSNKEQISIIQTVSSVTNVSIEDSACTGLAVLKFVQEGDALPLEFDNNFEIINTMLSFNQPETQTSSVESQSIVNRLRNKLTEARYTTKCNEKTYKEYVKIRQLAAFSVYQKTGVDIQDSDVNLNIKQISSALKVNIHVPVVNICNKKIVIILRIFNNNSESMENVHVLLHGSSLPSISYTTKLYNKSPKVPYFEEIDTEIKSNTESIVIATIDVEELKYNITSRIDFDIVVSYKMNDNFFLLPFESVSVSALDTMGTNFDLLASEKDFSKMALAVLATSHKVDLQLRHLKNENDAQTITFSEVFHNYLNMKAYSDYENIAIHNESPYHVLHGVLVVLNTEQDNIMNVEVHTRHPSQALALIHYMYDKIPHKLIATTPDIKISPVNNLMNELLKYTKDPDVSNMDYKNYILIVTKQIKLIKKYLSDCIKKTNEEGSNSNSKINYMVLGIAKYTEFRQHLMKLQVSQALEPSV